MVRSFQEESTGQAFLPFLLLRSRTFLKIHIRSDCDFLRSRLHLCVPGHCQEENTKSNRTWMEMLANKNHQRAPCLVDNELCIARRESRSHFQLLADSCGESQSNR